MIYNWFIKCSEDSNYCSYDCHQVVGSDDRASDSGLWCWALETKPEHCSGAVSGSCQIVEKTGNWTRPETTASRHVSIAEQTSFEHTSLCIFGGVTSSCFPQVCCFTMYFDFDWREAPLSALNAFSDERPQTSLRAGQLCFGAVRCQMQVQPWNQHFWFSVVYAFHEPRAHRCSGRQREAKGDSWHTSTIAGSQSWWAESGVEVWWIRTEVSGRRPYLHKPSNHPKRSNKQQKHLQNVMKPWYFSPFVHQFFAHHPRLAIGLSCFFSDFTGGGHFWRAALLSATALGGADDWDGVRTLTKLWETKILRVFL